MVCHARVMGCLSICSGANDSILHPTDEALCIMQAYNWYSVPKQVESVRKLLQYDFLHICPGGEPLPRTAQTPTWHLIALCLHKCILTDTNAFPLGLLRGCYLQSGAQRCCPECSVPCMAHVRSVYVPAGHGRPGHLRDAAHQEELINDLLASENAL